MTKTQLITEVCTSLKDHPQTSAGKITENVVSIIIDKTFQMILEELGKDEKVKIHMFGYFIPTYRTKRVSHLFAAKSREQVTSYKTITFHPSKRVRGALTEAYKREMEQAIHPFLS